MEQLRENVETFSDETWMTEEQTEWEGKGNDNFIKIQSCIGTTSPSKYCLVLTRISQY